MSKPEVLLVGFFSPVNWLSAHAKDKETVKDCFDEHNSRRKGQDNRSSNHQPTNKGEQITRDYHPSYHRPTDKGQQQQQTPKDNNSNKQQGTTYQGWAGKLFF